VDIGGRTDRYDSVFVCWCCILDILYDDEEVQVIAVGATLPRAFNKAWRTVYLEIDDGHEVYVYDACVYTL